MPLVHLSDMLDAAKKGGYTLNAYPVKGLPTLRKALAKAEADKTPLILSVCGSEHSTKDLELLLPAMDSAARTSKLPAAILVTNCSGRKKAVAAVRLGATALAGPEDKIADVAAATGVSLVTADAPLSISKSSGDGKAKALLKAARPWRNVQHLIYFNASVDDADAKKRMAIGVEALAKIPGVRSCVAGERIAGKDSYTYCWVVTLSEAAALETYTTHPDHVAYADKHFRPMADDRITIDFQPVPGGER